MERKKSKGLVDNIDMFADDIFDDYESEETKTADYKDENYLTKYTSKEKTAHDEKLDDMMTAVFWFKEMAGKKRISEEEKRYLELIIIQLSKFYFPNLADMNPSPKCEEAIQEILKGIEKKYKKTA